MEDDWEADEIETELAPISVQLAYVRQVKYIIFQFEFYILGASVVDVFYFFSATWAPTGSHGNLYRRHQPKPCR